MGLLRGEGRTEDLVRDERAVELLLHELHRSAKSFGHVGSRRHQGIVRTAQKDSLARCKRGLSGARPSGSWSSC